MKKSLIVIGISLCLVLQACTDRKVKTSDGKQEEKASADLSSLISLEESSEDNKSKGSEQSKGIDTITSNRNENKASTEISNEIPSQNTQDKSKLQNEVPLRPRFSIEYDDDGVIFYGSIMNIADYTLKQCKIQLFLNFKDGREHLAWQKYIDNLEPQKSFNFKDDITQIFREEHYNSLDTKGYRFAIVDVESATEADEDKLEADFEIRDNPREGIRAKGSLNNLTNDTLKPFLLKFYVTFKDGKEYFAFKRNIGTIDPQGSFKMVDVIKKLFEKHGYKYEDNIFYRIEVINE